MAGSVNKVTLIGNLCADPEVRNTQDGRPIVNLRVATTESWRDRNSGEKRERTEGHRVVIFAAPDDPYALREVLVNNLAMHPTDAMIRAHAAPGILPDRLSAEEAAQWVAAIGQLGLHAEAIPAVDIPDFGHAVERRLKVFRHLDVAKHHPVTPHEQAVVVPPVAAQSVKHLRGHTFVVLFVLIDTILFDLE